jgi:drug/metabolite transporter (DMT)-like permease
MEREHSEVGHLNITKNFSYFLMGVAAVAWGTSGTLAILAIDTGATANQIAVFAAIFSALILLPLIHIFDRGSLRVKRKDLLPLLLFGTVTGSIFSLAWYNCVDLTSVTTALILLYTYPSIVTIASVFLLGEKMTVAKGIALPLTFAGCVLVAEAYDLENIRVNIVGIALGLYTGVAAAAYYLWTKVWLREYSSNTVALYLALFTVPGVVLISGAGALTAISLSAEAWVLIFLIGLVPGTIGFVLSMVALRHIEASKASIVASIEPVAGVAIAVVAIAEKVSSLQTIGVALVVSGVILLRLAHRDEPEPTVEAPPSR